MLCAHPHHRAGRAPIFIVAPVACPSSSLRRSNTHLHPPTRCAPTFIVAPVVRPSSLWRLSRAHIHRHAHFTPIFIIAPIARLSLLLRPSRAHLHCRAVKRSRSLRHCTLSFILPSCSQLHLFIAPLCAHLSIDSYEFQCFTDQLAYIFITHNLVATMFLANFSTSEQFFKYATAQKCHPI